MDIKTSFWYMKVFSLWKILKEGFPEFYIFSSFFFFKFSILFSRGEFNKVLQNIALTCNWL